MSSLRDMLPGLYRGLLPAFFDGAAPSEEKATCSNCAMCPPPDAPPAAASSYFRPDVKCCTYHPRLPNYLVGALLCDDTPELAEGRRRVERLIASRVGVTPGWLAPPRKTRILYHAARRGSFGRSLVLRCPYYEAEGGLCTIWRWRETDCSTFFCKYSAGADGQSFWRGLNGYLHEVQRRLSADAVAAVAPHLEEPNVEPGEMTTDDLEDRPPSDYATFWKDWEGRELELYRACYRHVAGLDAARFTALAQGEAADRLAVVERLYGVLQSPRLPERLALSPEFAARRQSDEADVLLSTYSDYDPLMVSAALYDVVKERFTGQETVAEVKARFLAEEGAELPDDVLLLLHRMRVLVEPPPPESDPPASS
jgi:hypothetical protein